MEENHGTLFNIYLEYYIHRNHQLPRFSSTNWKKAPTLVYRIQPEGSYNSLNSLAPTGRKLQPEGMSNSLDSLAPTP
jgi:hypothetical protein